MKIAVINKSGNVGKSTVTDHVFRAHKPELKRLRVEDLNNSDNVVIEGSESDEFKASEFRFILREIMYNDDCIVDVGSSNYARFFEETKKFRGSIGEFDMFVVPTTPDPKIQLDTIETIELLASEGVPADKIRVLFNEKPDEETPLPAAYAAVFDFLERPANKGKCSWEPTAIVFYSDVFAYVYGSGQTISDIAQDPTDYRQIMKDVGKSDVKAFDAAYEAHSRKITAATVAENLRAAFNAMMAKAKPNK